VWWFDRLRAHRRAVRCAAGPRKSSWWRRGHQRRAEAALVTEGEAFLLGSLAELIERWAGSGPVWAWTNLLAHRTEEDLRDAAAVWAGGGTERTRLVPIWRPKCFIVPSSTDRWPSSRGLSWCP
jgi:hypothetical protein